MSSHSATLSGAWAGWSGSVAGLAGGDPGAGLRVVNMSAHDAIPPNEASPQPAEEGLLERIAAGDTAAFAEFYDRHSSILYSLILRIVGDSHEAEETLQEASLLIWERAASYRPSAGKPLSWAVAIARNKAIDRIRSTQRKAKLIAELTQQAPEFHTHPASGPGETMQRETATLMRAALGGLPPEQRQAIDLAFFSGLSQSEIAGQLGQPLGTIKARIRRGMLALKDGLEGRL